MTTELGLLKIRDTVISRKCSMHVGLRIIWKIEGYVTGYEII
jgi:hypothetical protein